MTKEVMQQALEALRMPCAFWNKTQCIKVTEAIKALEETIKKYQFSHLNNEVLLQYPKNDVEWQKQQMEHEQQLNSEAQKQEQDEPVAFFRKENGENIYYATKAWDDCFPLYAKPQAKEWVGLTEDEMRSIAEWQISAHRPLIDVIKAVEQALKEKNT